MYAVHETGGKQYRWHTGEAVESNRCMVKSARVSSIKVLALVDGRRSQSGWPMQAPQW